MNSLKKNEKQLVYISFISPALFIFLAVIAFPVISSIFIGFTKYNVYKNEFTWVGLKHYIRIMKDPVFWMAFKNNMLVVLMTVFIQIPLGFILAYILYRKIVKFANFFQSMTFLPITISTIVVGILWSKTFSPVGVFTKLMKIIYNDPDYIMTIVTNKQLAMVPILFVMIWIYTGFYMVVFLANMQKINPSIIEAAVIDGASEFHILTKIIVPSLAGITVSMMIIGIGGSLRSFDLVFAMTQGGPAHYTDVLALYMYNNTFGSINNYGKGSAISVIMVIISILLISIVRFIKNKMVDED